MSIRPGDPRTEDQYRERIAQYVAQNTQNANSEDFADFEPHESGSWPDPIPFGPGRLPQFPAHALPDWLCRFVEELATATQTPVDLPGTLVLGALAASVASKAKIEVKKGYREPLNLYVVSVMPPGSRKSTVFADVIRPIQEFEREERARLAPAILADRSSYQIRKQELRRAEREAVRAPEDERAELRSRAAQLAQEFYGTPEPVLPRFITDDVTPEKLTVLLHEQGGRMAVFSPEGDVFEIMAGRYSKRGPNFAVFNKAHAGDAIYVDRIGRASDFVARPALTMALAVQPDVIHQLSRRPGFRGRGLLGRFLYSLPDSLLGRRASRAPPVADETREEYVIGLRHLLGLHPAKDGTGDRKLHVLTLDDDAARALDEFEAWLEPQLAPTGELGTITDWPGKLVGAVARLAGVLHLAEGAARPEDWSTTVKASSVNSAVELGKYFIPHAQAALAHMGADPAVDNARHVLDWAKRKNVPTFSRRDAFQDLRGRFERVSDLERVLDLLEDHCYLRSLPTQERRGPGRPPGPKYEINPQVLNHDDKQP